MTDQELQAAETRLAELNAENDACRTAIEQCVEEIETLSMRLQELDLKRKQNEAHRRKAKAEYGRLYEQVGAEKKRREALDAEEAEAK